MQVVKNFDEARLAQLVACRPFWAALSHFSLNSIWEITVKGTSSFFSDCLHSPSLWVYHIYLSVHAGHASLLFLLKTWNFKLAEDLKLRNNRAFYSWLDLLKFRTRIRGLLFSGTLSSSSLLTTEFQKLFPEAVISHPDFERTQGISSHICATVRFFRENV